jgi:hypothetical protein
MTKPRREFVFTGSGAHGRRDGAPPLAPTIGQAQLGSARANLVPGITRPGRAGVGNTNETKCRKLREACCAVAAAGRQRALDPSLGSVPSNE